MKRFNLMETLVGYIRTLFRAPKSNMAKAQNRVRLVTDHTIAPSENLTEISPDDPEFRTAKMLAYSSNAAPSQDQKIVSVQRISSPSRVKTFVERSRKLGRYSHLIHGYHGTPARNIESIAQKGLLIGDGASCGRGIYMADSVHISLLYANGDGTIIICLADLGQTQRRNLDGSNPFSNHSATIGSMTNRFYVVPDQRRVLPLYVVKYSSVSKE